MPLPRLRWTRRRLTVAVAAVVVIALAAGLTLWWTGRDDDSRFSAAVALAPESSLRFSWTDWAGVRDELGAADLTASSTGEDLDAFLLDAFDRGLSGVSALTESARAIHDDLGFSPASIDWELIAQGKKGAIVIMGLPDGFDADAVQGRLVDAGFTRPDEKDGVWLGGADLLETLSGPVTPELAYLRFDPDRHLLLGSDNADYLEASADQARGDRDDGVRDAVAATGSALSALALTGDQACTELSMTEADPADRARAAELVRDAGEVHPLTAFVLAALPGGDLRAALGLETSDQARTDADSRSRLAAGPAPGQGGTFPERFALGKVTARDTVVTMELEPAGAPYLLADLSDGPLLFATC